MEPIFWKACLFLFFQHSTGLKELHFPQVIVSALLLGFYLMEDSNSRKCVAPGIHEFLNVSASLYNLLPGGSFLLCIEGYNG
jgi:hypothetical protein